jgi:hypothetical protein
MPRRAALILTALIAALLFLFLHHLHRPQPHQLPAAPMQHEPLAILWAWETPEDLTTLDPSRTGVAFLARELLLSGSGPTAHLTLRPRRQPLLVAPNTWLMADVRLETAPNFSLNPQIINDTAQAIAAALQQPNVRALQVDFDAALSQRAFYTAVLQRLRAILPPTTPLSITALVSWCGPHSWLTPLASTVDEAVPMFFRMGGPSATRALTPRSTHIITEPLCSTSAGLATDEAWPTLLPTQRAYLFHTGPWTKLEIAQINHLGYQSLQASLPKDHQP